MIKRKIIFDDYDTADHLWTLAAWSCPAPDPVTEMVDVPGRVDGPLDFSTVLAGGIRYGSRTLEATLESSEGTRLERKARIDEIINKLHGQRVKIWLPDDEGRYLTGRISVRQEYNDPAHAAVTVSGVCDPWLYDNNETMVGETVADGETKTVTLPNDRRPVCPRITVTGEVTVGFNEVSYALSEGTYQLPEIWLTEGANVVTVQGAGSVTFTYRGAVL